MKNDWDAFERGILAQSGNELVAVHGGHQNVGNDEIRRSELRLLQSLFAVVRFNHLVPEGGQQRHVELAALNVIVDDEDQCHGYSARFGMQSLSCSSSICGSIGLEMNFFAPCTRARSCSRVDQTEEDRKTKGILDNSGSDFTMRMNS